MGKFCAYLGVGPNYDETKINFSGALKGDTLDLKMQFGNRKPVLMTAKRN
jgi:hypothetical protein